MGAVPAAALVPGVRVPGCRLRHPRRLGTWTGFGVHVLSVPGLPAYDTDPGRRPGRRADHRRDRGRARCAGSRARRAHRRPQPRSDRAAVLVAAAIVTALVAWAVVRGLRRVRTTRSCSPARAAWRALVDRDLGDRRPRDRHRQAHRLRRGPRRRLPRRPGVPRDLHRRRLRRAGVARLHRPVRQRHGRRRHLGRRHGHAATAVHVGHARRCCSSAAPDLASRRSRSSAPWSASSCGRRSTARRQAASAAEPPPPSLSAIAAGLRTTAARLAEPSLHPRVCPSTSRRRSSAGVTASRLRPEAQATIDDVLERRSHPRSGRRARPRHVTKPGASGSGSDHAGSSAMSARTSRHPASVAPIEDARSRRRESGRRRGIVTSTTDEPTSGIAAVTHGRGGRPTLGQHGVDEVARHDPIGRPLAADDREHARCDPGDAVLAGDLRRVAADRLVAHERAESCEGVRDVVRGDRTR